MKTQLHSNFRLVRILDEKMLASNCKMDITLEVGKHADLILYQRKLEQIKLWINVILNDSIAYNGNVLLRDLLSTFENNIILCPDKPHDFLLPSLIHSKLNAIGDGYVTITETAFMSDAGDGFSTTFTGDQSEWLPSNTEWMGTKTYFDKQWWNRSDGSTIDIRCNEDDDVLIKPDILIDLDSTFDDDDSELIPSNAVKAEIIKPQFKIIKSDDS